MINEKVNKIIREIVEELKSKYPDFRGLYLFGSYARGEETEDSDIDLALIFEREIDWQFKSLVSKIVNQYDINYDVLIDIFLFNNNQINHPIMPLTENITLEGIYYD